MALTINELKKRYYQSVLEKGYVIYASWGKERTTSKQIAAKANEYAFDKRLKADEVFRFQALAFLCALGVRLEKRYRTFLRKLFLLFAFLRERAALQMLKRVLGFDSYTDLREMIEVEAEKLFMLLSQRFDQDTTGGGKLSVMGEISLEEQLENFLEECTLEEDKKEAGKDLPPDNAEPVEDKAEPSSVKPEVGEREKISVDETTQSEKEVKEEKDISQKEKTEQRKKEEKGQKETDAVENKKEGKPTKPAEKSVANTSILAEKMMEEQRQEKEAPSPFPIFREAKDGKVVVENKEDSVEPKVQNETKPMDEKDEVVEKDSLSEFDFSKSPFPIFKGENGELMQAVEKPIESAIKSEKEGTFRETMEVSEENRARRALNITMSKEQLEAIVAQIKEAAKITMAQEEREWREQISVGEGQNVAKTNPKTVSKPQNNANVKNAPKK